MTMPSDGPQGEGVTIGVLIPEFPGQTHVLFWREIRRLRQLGATVHLVSTRRPERPCPHHFAQEPCRYVWPPAGLQAGLPRAGRLLGQIRFALSLRQGGWRERLTVLSMLPSSWALAAWCRKHGVEHLHVHSFANSAYLGALLRIGAGVPFSAVLHGGPEVYGLNHAAKLAHAAFAGAVDATLRARIEEIRPGVSLDRLTPCGVPLETFTAAERTPGPVLQLISVGRLNHCKGVAFALQALARVRPAVPVAYTLVGSGPDEDDLRRQAAALGLDDVVTFAGARSQAEVVGLLHRHHVAVMTSHGLGESTAIAIREAMATGMPVIMSDIGDARNMIEPYRTGLIVPQQDVGAIADAFRWFHANRDRIPAMGAAARAKAERDFGDWTAPRILLEEIIGRRSRTRTVPARTGSAAGPFVAHGEGNLPG